MSEEKIQKTQHNIATENTSKDGPARLPPSRRGKKAVTAYVEPETHKQLRILGLELGMSSQDMIIEALEDFFEKAR